MDRLPLIRSHERMDFKRCPKKWYWKWRRGLVSRRTTFGALDLGTWVHAAFELWYARGTSRNGSLPEHFNTVANLAIDAAVEARTASHEIIKAEELAALGEAMMQAYVRRYGDDSHIDVIGTEIPLEFIITDDQGAIIAKHILKPDMVYRDTHDNSIWLMENKTATTVRTGHLVIDDQARPYGTLAERALKKVGALKRNEVVRGVMYNYLKKSLPDNRETDAEGRYLNKNGSVSARQPAPAFIRHPVRLTTAAKRQTLFRLRQEAILITKLTQRLRDGSIHPGSLPKTPHNSCPKLCPYFTMCVAEENGADIQMMEKKMFRREDPYSYGETTDESIGFEMG